MKVSTASTPYIQVQVTPHTELGTVGDPTNDIIEMTFLPDGQEPTLSTVWFPATWQTDTIHNRFYAQCQIGLNTTVGVLSVGTWRPWVRVTDNPELLVLEARTAFTMI